MKPRETPKKPLTLEMNEILRKYKAKRALDYLEWFAFEEKHLKTLVQHLKLALENELPESSRCVGDQVIHHLEILKEVLDEQS